MELWCLLPLLPFLLLLLKLAGNRRRGQPPAPRFPPGPSQLPIIGCMHHLLGMTLPHHTLRDLAGRYGPVMHLKLGEISMVVVTSAEAAQEILKTQDTNFASRPQMLVAQIISYGRKNMAMAPYGDYWRQMRKLSILELFSSKRVQSFRRIREEETDHLIRSIFSAAGSRTSTGLINLSDKLYSLTNDITARALFGKKCSEQRRFIPLMREIIELGGAFNLADFFPSSRLAPLVNGFSSRLHRCHDDVDKILGSIVEEHRARRQASRDAGDEGQPDEESDLLDVLLQLQEGGDLKVPLTVDHIKALLLDLFIAGSETSSSTMQWAMSELMRKPRVMKRAQSEVRKALSGKEKVTEEDICGLHYVRMVIKETLRLHPPIPLLLPREARESCEVLGYDIPRKTRVIVNAWAMGRDPRYWDDAESFVPERFDGSRVDFRGAYLEYIPFGAGRRTCPGMSFGMASVELPLARLLYHFDWELPGGDQEYGGLDMSESFGATSSRRTDLYLCAIPRVPLCL